MLIQDEFPFLEWTTLAANGLDENLKVRYKKVAHYKQLHKASERRMNVKLKSQEEELQGITADKNMGSYGKSPLPKLDEPVNEMELGVPFKREEHVKYSIDVC